MNKTGLLNDASICFLMSIHFLDDQFQPSRLANQQNLGEDKIK